MWRRQDVVGKKDTSRSASSVSPASASALSSSKSSRSSSSPSPSPTTTSAVESPSVRSLTTSPAAVAVVPARLSGNVGSDHMLHDMQIHLRDDDEDGEQQTPEEPYHPAGKASPTVRVVTTDGREGWEIPRTSVAGLHTGSTHPVVQGRSISNSSSGISCRTPGGGEQRYPRTEYPVARRERGSSPLVQKSHHQRRGGGVPYTDSSMTSQMALVLRSAVEAGALDRVDADEVFQFLFEIFSEERMVDESRQTGSVDVSHPSLAHHHEDKGEEREYGKAPHYHYHGRIVDRCGENVSIELQEPSPLSFARANANGHHSYPSRRKSSDASLSDLQELRSQLETRKFVHD